jgi:glycosyltransferase involved in cell wall biosynthesis
VVVTLHDLYPFEIPQNFGFPQVIFNQIILKNCLKNADAIACVSAATQLRLEEYADGDVCKKAIHIPNVVETTTYESVEGGSASLPPKPFLLCVAQHRRNKNIPFLIRTFHRMLQGVNIAPNMKLVIIGIEGPETNRIKDLIHKLELKDTVHLREGLTESEIQSYYRQCEVLVTPSLTEGFGLPVAEGMLAGCRIVCSDIPAFREVGDGYCRFVKVNEDSEVELAEAVEVILKEPPKQPALLSHLSSEILADKYRALFTALLAASSETSRRTVVHSPVQEKL